MVPASLRRAVVALSVAAAIAPATALAAKTVTISAFGSPKQIKQWDRIFGLFEKANPGIKVKPTYSAYVDFDKLVLHMAAGVAPDVTLLWGWYVAQLAPRDLLRPMDSATVKEFGARMFPKMAQLCSWKGKVIAMPWMVGASGIFWNETMFSQAGVPFLTDESGYDMSSFRSSATKLTKDKNGDGKPEQWGFVWYPYLVREWMNWVWKSGGEILDADKKRFLLDGPEACQALQWLADLAVVNKACPPITHADMSGPWQTFFDGRAAMYPAGAWNVELMRASSLKVRSGPFPKAKKDMTAVESFTASVTSGAKYPKEALALVKYICLDTTAQTLISEAGWGSPVVPKVAADVFVTKGDPYGESYFLKELRSGDIRPLPYTTSMWTQIEETIRSGYNPMFLGKVSALEAAKRVKPNVERLLARVK